MTLLLIRHGETELNAGRVVQFPDTPLGPHGLAQADRLGRHLAGHGVARVLCSDYLRARTTAEHVARHCGAPLAECALLRERHFGDLRGRSYETFGGQDIFAPDYVPPGGESWPDFDARVDRAWQEILRHADEVAGALAVVTHGLVLRSLLERVLDANGHVIPQGLTVPNTSLTVVGREAPWPVLELAVTPHLEDGRRDVAPA